MNGAVAAPRHMAGRSPPRGKCPTAKAMARCCGEFLFTNPALLAKAQAEHGERPRATPYVCPLPKDLRASVG